MCVVSDVYGLLADVAEEWFGPRPVVVDGAAALCAQEKLAARLFYSRGGIRPGACFEAMMKAGLVRGVCIEMKWLVVYLWLIWGPMSGVIEDIAQGSGVPTLPVVRASSHYSETAMALYATVRTMDGATRLRTALLETKSYFVGVDFCEGCTDELAGGIERRAAVCGAMCGAWFGVNDWFVAEAWQGVNNRGTLLVWGVKRLWTHSMSNTRVGSVATTAAGNLGYAEQGVVRMAISGAFHDHVIEGGWHLLSNKSLPGLGGVVCGILQQALEVGDEDTGFLWQYLLNTLGADGVVELMPRGADDGARAVYGVKEWAMATGSFAYLEYSKGKRTYWTPMGHRRRQKTISAKSLKSFDPATGERWYVGSTLATDALFGTLM